MKRPSARKVLALTLLAVLCGQGLVLAEGATALTSPPKIIVGLTRAASVTLSSQSALALSGIGTPVNPAVPDTVPPGVAVTLSASGSGVSWGYTSPGSATQVGQSACPVLLGKSTATQPPQSAAPVIAVTKLSSPTSNVAGRSYRGAMIAIPASGSLLLANVVDMEDYVQSTVGGEMPDGWPAESLKAQAVAVRSFASYKVGLTKAGAPKDYEKDFRSVTAADVLLWATEQVYRGVGEESPQSIAATKDTRGQVLVYSGRPAAAYFHSDAGGMTEDPRYVWGGAVPYLQAVREAPHGSPYSLWTVRLTPEEFAAGFRSIGIIADPLPDIITGCEPGVSGRWKGVAVMTAGGAKQVSADQFRLSAFPQVRSMLFSSYSFGGGKETRGLLGAETGVYVQSEGKVSQVKVGSSVILGDGGATVRNARSAYASTGSIADSQLTYVLQGSGWGHGVGLSQYGARGMALSGSDAVAILKLYYPGTALEKWWP